MTWKSESCVETESVVPYNEAIESENVNILVQIKLEASCTTRKNSCRSVNVVANIPKSSSRRVVSTIVILNPWLYSYCAHIIRIIFTDYRHIFWKNYHRYEYKCAILSLDCGACPYIKRYVALIMTLLCVTWVCIL